MNGDPELDALIRRFETGIGETTAKFKSQGQVIVIGAVVMAGLAAVRQIWFLIPVCLLSGVAIWFLMRAAVKKSGPERAAPVLEALRLAPGRIKKISHRVTSGRMVVTHWIEVLSDEGRIFVRADDDWAALLESVSKRCPQATLERGE